MLCSLVYRPISSFAQDGIVQQIAYLNLPAYRLSLYTQYIDKHWEQFTLTVGVGRGWRGRDQTPTGRGDLHAKATGVTFQYGAQNPTSLAGKTITHSNTFDKATLQPVTIRMPRDMKSIFMKINSDTDARAYTRYVLHETTDWYTIGTPASNGCVRIEREDMQRLYNLIVPSVREGDFPKTVPISIYYDVAEYDHEQQMVVLHANIYNRPVDYIHEILHDLREAGIETSLMNMPALLNIVKQAEAQFARGQNILRQRLRKSPFERLIHEHEKQLLHFTFYLKFHY